MLIPISSGSQDIIFLTFLSLLTASSSLYDMIPILAFSMQEAKKISSYKHNVEKPTCLGFNTTLL